MPATTTRTFRERLARHTIGEAPLVVAVSARVGTGRYSPGGGVVTPLPTDTNLENAVISDIPVTLEVQGHSTIITATVAGGATPYQITEAGLFTADGAAILLEAFLPTQLQQNQSLNLKYTLFPEVDQS